MGMLMRGRLSAVKRKRAFLPILFLATLMTFISCGGGGNGGGGVVPPPDPSPDSFKFIVISDMHVRIPGNPDDGVYDNAGNLNKFTGALDLIRTKHPDAEFVVVSGDTVGCLFSRNPDDYGVGGDNPAERFKTMMDTLGKPYYVALGNHDYQEGFDAAAREGITSNDPGAMEAIWKKVLDVDPYYSFVHRGVRIIVLNSMRGPEYITPCPSANPATRETGCKGSFDDAQINWLENELRRPEYCLLIIHHPVITDNNNVKNWSAAGLAMQVRAEDRFYEVARAYKDRIKGIFVGHGHRKEKDTLEGEIPVHETASIGDFGGAANHVRVVWMDPFTGIMITQ